MPFWADHLLVAVLAVFFPLRAATFGYRRLAQAPLAAVPTVRRSLFLQAIAIQWSLAFVVLGLWTWQARSWPALGLVPRGWVGLAAGLLLAAAVATWLAMLRARARRDPEALGQALERARHLERILPATRPELRLFQAVSVTAGICEELLYRGYLMWYFGHGMGPWAALAVSSLLFGLGHAYQGWKGIAGTTLVGAALGAVYVWTGTLWPSMALHAITDLHAGSLAHDALRMERERAMRQEVGSGEVEA